MTPVGGDCHRRYYSALVALEAPAAASFPLNSTIPRAASGSGDGIPQNRSQWLMTPTALYPILARPCPESRTSYVLGMSSQIPASQAKVRQQR
jgi:hypothetical protein